MRDIQDFHKERNSTFLRKKKDMASIKCQSMHIHKKERERERISHDNKRRKNTLVIRKIRKLLFMKIKTVEELVGCGYSYWYADFALKKLELRKNTHKKREK